MGRLVLELFRIWEQKEDNLGGREGNGE